MKKTGFLSIAIVLLMMIPSSAVAGIWYLPFPEGISTDGWRIDRVITYIDLVMTIAFGLVVASLIYFIFRYRAREGHKAVYDKGNKAANIIATICLGSLVFFSIDAVIEKMAFHDLKEVFWNFPQGENVLKIEIMPQQFAWNFRYAGSDGQFATSDDLIPSINQMHIPVNTPVVVQMSPLDVVHSFYVPNLRFKQDAVPGMVTTFWFEAKKEGTYEIACSALCGLGHTNMRGFLTVESKEKFDAWLRQLQLEQVSSSDADDVWAEEDTTGAAPAQWGWPWQSKRP